jgi:hypothetical protein
MSEKSLREQLVGAWVLTNCVERDIETAVENHPLGDRPLGLIMPNAFRPKALRPFRLTSRLRQLAKEEEPLS